MILLDEDYGNMILLDEHLNEDLRKTSYVDYLTDIFMN